MISRVDVLILIAFLGVGTVVAVPRHVQLATESRVAEVTALGRSAVTAAQLAHSQWLAANQPPVIDGARGVVAMTYGYPSAATLPLMLGESETGSFVYRSGMWQHVGAADDSPCGVAYLPPAAPGQNPAVTPQTAGC